MPDPTFALVERLLVEAIPDGARCSLQALKQPVALLSLLISLTFAVLLGMRRDAGRELVAREPGNALAQQHMPPARIQRLFQSARTEPLTQWATLKRSPQSARRKRFTQPATFAAHRSDAAVAAVARIAVAEAPEKAAVFRALDAGSNNDVRAALTASLPALEASNPTRHPTFSGALTGKWAVKYTGGVAEGPIDSPTREIALVMYSAGFGPGAAALSLANRLPDNLMQVKTVSLDITKPTQGVPGQSRATLAVCLLDGQQDADLELFSELEAAGPAKLVEKGTQVRINGGATVSIPAQLQYKRDIFVTYLDDELLVARDATGSPDIFVRDAHNEKVARGPPQLPVIQNALDFIRYGGMSDMSSALGKEYGGIAVARNNDREFFFLNDPELVKEVTVTQSNVFYNRLGAQPQTENNATGIVSAAKVDHKRYRALANPFFFSKRLLEQYTSIVEREAHTAMASWKAGSEVDIQPVFKRLTLNVISKIAFTELETGGEQTIRLIREVLDASGDLQRERQVSMLLTRLGEPVDNFTASLPINVPRIADVVAPPSRQKMLEFSKRLRAIENGIINARREQFEASRREASEGHSIDLPNDLLSVLINSTEDEKRPLTDGEIQTIVREIIIAGSDTTASSISATLFLLARDAQRQRRVLRELDNVLGTDTSTPITYAQVDQLTYLRLCVKEAMRLYPAADVIFRTAGETTNIGGYRIPEGAGVIISPVALGRNVAQWGQDADSFRPERFEETGADGQLLFPKHSFAWLPFGAGPRACLGGRLALMEATTACATVLRRWGLKAPKESELATRYSVTVDFDGGVGVTIMPRDVG